MNIIKPTLTIVLISISLLLSAQNTDGGVGINTDTPQEALDVNGKTYTNDLYLRNPGEPTTSGGKFLVSANDNSTETTLKLLNMQSGNNAIFNYITLNLTGVSKHGISNYDTKIDADKYILVLHNYSVKLNADQGVNNATKVMLDYDNDGANNNAQGSPEFTSFKEDGTWRIKAKFTNSALKKLTAPNEDYNNFTIELYMVAYRKLITKQNINDVTIDLEGTDGSNKTLNKPTGF